MERDCRADGGRAKEAMIGRHTYNKLMSSYTETGLIGASAIKAGVDRKTASDYIHGRRVPPGEPRERRHWRTHEDDFAEVWPEVEEHLRREPDLEAKTLFEDLKRRYEGRFSDSQRRTFERRVRAWKRRHGPEPERFFGQCHRPGERLQLDWFGLESQELVIAGESMGLKLVHGVLPYSNWSWARVCFSESFLSLKKGLQGALFELGAVPRFCQTDQSSTATHSRGKGRRRAFNDRYLSLLGHFGMKAATIGVAQAHQNGDAESLNGALKRDLEQALKLRGSREFGNLAAFEVFVEEIVHTRNAGCRKALQEELLVMPALTATRLPEYEEIEVRVGREGIARVGKQGYSVPTRWIGRRLRVRLSETEVVFHDGAEEVARTTRRSGDSGVFVDWRHVIADLVGKPGAFERWRHRESLFPSALWRDYYRLLRENGSEARAAREYVHSLHLALEHGLEAVQAVLGELGEEASLDRLRAALKRSDSPREPVLLPDLSAYDALLIGPVAIESPEAAEVCHG